ncbi:non-ribosomal peptide synthetase, partial [Fulvivirga imtechensis]|uniref:non-ribosomal peptide synthetase n=1 Tax=Fulvivirga imtechensis TaxID=881893 RepID=UPI000590A5D0
SEVKEKTLNCFENQAYQYEELIEELSLPRDTSRNPLFDVMFSYINIDREELMIPGLTLHAHNSGHDITKFDLTLVAGESEEGLLYVSIGYSTDLFSAATIDRFITYFERIVEAVTTDFDQKLSEIDILSFEERKILLHQYNDTTADYSISETIVELFEAQVAENPDHPSLVFEGTIFSYSQLNGKANFLARKLLERGIEPHHTVPLVMSRGIEYVVSFLAIRKIGACCAPISIYWPAARLKEVLNGLDAPVVLVNQGGFSSLAESEIKSELFLVNHLEVGSSPDNLGSLVDPDSLMVMFHTSGTTGRPKGVLLTERGIYNRFMWMNDYFGQASSRSVLRTTKHIFDSSLWQLFWPLINGGKTIIPSEDKPLDLEYFSELLNAHEVTMTDFVPSLFNDLVRELESSTSQGTFVSLFDIVIGGEAISVSTVNKFRKLCPNIRLTNLYGPTEASIGCIYYPIEGSSYRIIPIGKSISNMNAYILDKNGKLCAPGVSGELCLGGVGLAKGYFKLPELTSDKFIPNPFKPGEKVYKTGDLARWLPDGNIEYLGRIDHQVKIRGFRIELGEIESHLTSHEAIREAVVLAKEREGDKYLVGYYVSKEALSSSELRDHLSKHLPEY